MLDSRIGTKQKNVWGALGVKCASGALHALSAMNEQRNGQRKGHALQLRLSSPRSTPEFAATLTGSSFCIILAPASNTSTVGSFVSFSLFGRSGFAAGWEERLARS